ncbi:MAG TPA: ABC-F family ATP-binding cassette domain-containing protein [Gemmatimonadales bacterium]|nr:ABC-F family ATP-binding cassette domain-containing protein [Gemmatimonadales bacterium]HRZ09614.1 ABC-F family ATP-binding cassette domain-containing protein [Gemmatimonadales bacterium]
MSQFSASGLAVEFGVTRLFADATFTIERGERWGVVGRNGTGKTTLFRLLAGTAQPSRGTVARESGLRISLMDQHRDFGDATLVWEAAAGPFAELLSLEASLAEQAAALGADPSEAAMDRYSRDLERFERDGGYTLAPRVDAVLHGLGFDPEAARTQLVATLSGGERGRVALARQLVAPADVLLLDEPTNHLDLETTRWLEDHLLGLDATVLVISHDRAFLARLSNRILHFEARTITAYKTGYAGFLEQRAERQLSQQRAFDKQRRNIEAEEDFIRRNIAGGNSAQAKGRRRRLERLPRLGPPPGEEGSMTVQFPPGERGGDQVLVAQDVRVQIDERVLLDRFSARVTRGEVVGLVGPNGAGKTTLLRALLGEMRLAAGELRLGDSIRPAWYRQDLGQVPQDKSLYDITADLRPMWNRGAIQSHLGAFGFSGDTVLRRAGSLSGGERARMALSMMVLDNANLLIFDEPTNHLDVESIEVLEDALSAWGGNILLVSHDRALLEALVTRVWVLHNARITDYPGTFVEWEEASREREHAAAVAAAEDESSRRVEERKRTRRGDDRAKDERAALRAARENLTAAEARVAAAERMVASLKEKMEDPALYATAEGGKRAARLGTDLEEARREFEAAFAAWEAATTGLEALGQ